MPPCTHRDPGPCLERTYPSGPAARRPPWTYNTTSLAPTIILLHRTTSKACIACPRAHSSQIALSWQSKVPPQTFYPWENPLHPTVKRSSTSDRFASSRRFETVCGTSWFSPKIRKIQLLLKSLKISNFCAPTPPLPCRRRRRR